RVRGARHVPHRPAPEPASRLRDRRALLPRLPSRAQVAARPVRGARLPPRKPRARRARREPPRAPRPPGAPLGRGARPPRGRGAADRQHRIVTAVMLRPRRSAVLVTWGRGSVSSRTILLIDVGLEPMDLLDARARRLDFRVVRAKTTDEAVRILMEPRFAIGCAVVPPDLPVPNLTRAVAAMRQAARCKDLPFLVAGSSRTEEGGRRARGGGR